MPLLDDSFLTPLSDSAGDNAGEYASSLVQSMVDQLNGAPQLYARLNPNGKLPLGLRNGDTIVGIDGSNQAVFSVWANGLKSISSSIIQQAMGFVGNDLQDNGVPTTDHLPNNGDWGFYLDTGSNNQYLAFNRAGSILKIQLT